jgi:hypothetical protein
MYPTNPQKDLKGREDAEPLWGTASERFLVWNFPSRFALCALRGSVCLTPYASR